MDIGHEELKLGANIAAVRLGGSVAGEDVTGVAVIIPAGEIVHLNRKTPVLGQMFQIEWKGCKYGVFLNDLQQRSAKHNKHKSSGANGNV